MKLEAPLVPYLATSPWVDPLDREVNTLIDARGWRRLAPEDAARRAYELVRDEILHSWDIQSHKITRTSGEALRHREGLCYSKSMLLSALLRALGIPSGLSYQRLLLGESPSEGHCIHGLTTAFLRGRWVRLDAGGNRQPGTDARFSLDEERLAFQVRPELGEVDLRDNHAVPPVAITCALESHRDLFSLMRSLPDWT